MKVTLEDYTPNPEAVIAKHASICYGSAVDSRSNHQRLLNILNQKHLSALRFAYATFHIDEVSLVESHQQVRVAHAGILQRSYRYNPPNGNTVIPYSFSKADTQILAKIAASRQLAFEAYSELIAAGVSKGDARYILPQNITTKLIMTGNFQMWHTWLAARTSPHAQWEIREVAFEIAKQLTTIAPNIFGDFVNANQ